MTNVLSRLFSIAGQSDRLMDYEESKELAANRKPGIRCKLAERADVQPEILYFLAEDPEPEVRREIAANQTTPVQADMLLARDDNDEVRCDVARKVSSLAPTLDSEQQERVGALVTEVLQVLAADQMPRVRRILAEELKDSAKVPPEVIDRLARDDDISVAAPVLENSPLLSDEFLLEIIASPTVQGALGAISRRGGLGEPVADAIARSRDQDAITELLSNKSAQIREQTLDELIDRAETVEAWHAPMVARPKLSSRSVRRLAEFVAESLVERLRDRRDIDPETARALSAAVRVRLDEEPAAAVVDNSDDGETADERARALHASGELDEDALGAALNKGERSFVIEALALRSGLPAAIVQKVISMASAKGTVALAWKAGLGMPFAVQLQLRLARVSPSSILKSAGEGDYPMSDDEMNWQIEFFAG